MSLLVPEFGSDGDVAAMCPNQFLEMTTDDEEEQCTI